MRDHRYPGIGQPPPGSPQHRVVGVVPAHLQVAFEHPRAAVQRVTDIVGPPLLLRVPVGDRPASPDERPGLLKVGPHLGQHPLRHEVGVDVDEVGQVQPPAELGHLHPLGIGARRFGGRGTVSREVKAPYQAFSRRGSFQFGRG